MCSQSIMTKRWVCGGSGPRGCLMNQQLTTIPTRNEGTFTYIWVQHFTPNVKRQLAMCTSLEVPLTSTVI